MSLLFKIFGAKSPASSEPATPSTPSNLSFAYGFGSPGIDTSTGSGRGPAPLPQSHSKRHGRKSRQYEPNEDLDNEVAGALEESFGATVFLRSDANGHSNLNGNGVESYENDNDEELNNRETAESGASEERFAAEPGPLKSFDRPKSWQRGASPTKSRDHRPSHSSEDDGEKFRKSISSPIGAVFFNDDESVRSSQIDEIAEVTSMFSEVPSYMQGRGSAAVGGETEEDHDSQYEGRSDQSSHLSSGSAFAEHFAALQKKKKIDVGVPKSHAGARGESQGESVHPSDADAVESGDEFKAFEGAGSGGNEGRKMDDGNVNGSDDLDEFYGFQGATPDLGPTPAPFVADFGAFEASFDSRPPGLHTVAESPQSNTKAETFPAAGAGDGKEAEAAAGTHRAAPTDLSDSVTESGISVDDIAEVVSQVSSAGRGLVLREFFHRLADPGLPGSLVNPFDFLRAAMDCGMLNNFASFGDVVEVVGWACGRIESSSESDSLDRINLDFEQFCRTICVIAILRTPRVEPRVVFESLVDNIIKPFTEKPKRVEIASEAYDKDLKSRDLLRFFSEHHAVILREFKHWSQEGDQSLAEDRRLSKNVFLPPSVRVRYGLLRDSDCQISENAGMSLEGYVRFLKRYGFIPISLEPADAEPLFSASIHEHRTGNDTVTLPEFAELLGRTALAVYAAEISSSIRRAERFFAFFDVAMHGDRWEDPVVVTIKPDKAKHHKPSTDKVHVTRTTTTSNRTTVSTAAPPRSTTISANVVAARSIASHSRAVSETASVAGSHLSHTHSTGSRSNHSNASRPSNPPGFVARLNQKVKEEKLARLRAEKAAMDAEEERKKRYRDAVIEANERRQRMKKHKKPQLPDKEWKGVDKESLNIPTPRLSTSLENSPDVVDMHVTHMPIDPDMSEREVRKAIRKVKKDVKKKMKTLPADETSPPKLAKVVLGDRLKEAVQSSGYGPHLNASKEAHYIKTIIDSSRARSVSPKKEPLPRASVLFHGGGGAGAPVERTVLRKKKSPAPKIHVPVASPEKPAAVAPELAERSVLLQRLQHAVSENVDCSSATDTLFEVMGGCTSDDAHREADLSLGSFMLLCRGAGLLSRKVTVSDVYMSFSSGASNTAQNSGALALSSAGFKTCLEEVGELYFTTVASTAAKRAEVVSRLLREQVLPNVDRITRLLPPEGDARLREVYSEGVLDCLQREAAVVSLIWNKLSGASGGLSLPAARAFAKEFALCPRYVSVDDVEDCAMESLHIPPSTETATCRLSHPEFIEFLCRLALCVHRDAIPAAKKVDLFLRNLRRNDASKRIEAASSHKVLKASPELRPTQAAAAVAVYSPPEPASAPGPANGDFEFDADFDDFKGASEVNDGFSSEKPWFPTTPHSPPFSLTHEDSPVLSSSSKVSARKPSVSGRSVSPSPYSYPRKSRMMTPSGWSEMSSADAEERARLEAESKKYKAEYEALMNSLSQKQASWTDMEKKLLSACNTLGDRVKQLESELVRSEMEKDAVRTNGRLRQIKLFEWRLRDRTCRRALNLWKKNAFYEGEDDARNSRVQQRRRTVSAEAIAKLGVDRRDWAEAERDYMKGLTKLSRQLEEKEEDCRKLRSVASMIMGERNGLARATVAAAFAAWKNFSCAQDSGNELDDSGFGPRVMRAMGSWRDSVQRERTYRVVKSYKHRTDHLYRRSQLSLAFYRLATHKKVSSSRVDEILLESVKRYTRAVPRRARTQRLKHAFGLWRYIVHKREEGRLFLRTLSRSLHSRWRKLMVMRGFYTWLQSASRAGASKLADVREEDRKALAQAPPQDMERRVSIEMHSNVVYGMRQRSEKLTAFRNWRRNSAWSKWYSGHVRRQSERDSAVDKKERELREWRERLTEEQNMFMADMSRREDEFLQRQREQQEKQEKLGKQQIQQEEVQRNLNEQQDMLVKQLETVQAQADRIEREVEIVQRLSPIAGLPSAPPAALGDASPELHATLSGSMKANTAKSAAKSSAASQRGEVQLTAKSLLEERESAPVKINGSVPEPTAEGEGAVSKMKVIAPKPRETPGVKANGHDALGRDEKIEKVAAEPATDSNANVSSTEADMMKELERTQKSWSGSKKYLEDTNNRMFALLASLKTKDSPRSSRDPHQS